MFKVYQARCEELEEVSGREADAESAHHNVHFIDARESAAPSSDFGRRERESTRALRDDLIIVQADGEVLRSGHHLSAEELVTIETATALLSLAIYAPRPTWPVWVDLGDAHLRIQAVAFDDQIIFARLTGGDAAAVAVSSRAAFIEKVRQMVDDGSL